MKSKQKNLLIKETLIESMTKKKILEDNILTSNFSDL